MNLISCDNCGVVLDKDMLVHQESYDNNNELINDNVNWVDDYAHATFKCPVCSLNITDKETKVL